MRWVWPLIVVMGLLSAGCKPQAQSVKADASAVGLPHEVTPTQGALDLEVEFAEIRTRILPSVNDRVPRALMDKLKFAPQFDSHNRVVALAPEAWVMGAVPGTLRPAADAGLGASTSMSFGSACDGRCAPKDWAASFDKVEIRSLQVQHIDVDEPIGKVGRVIVARSGAVSYVVAGIWKPEGNRYFFCRATLEGAAFDALQAFVGACRAMDVRRWD